MKYFCLFVMLMVAWSSHAVTSSDADSVAVSTVDDTDKLPVVSPYYFQHQYLSEICTQIDEVAYYMLEDVEALNTLSPHGNGFASPFKDSDIQVERFEVNGKVIVVWKFPETKYLREALYMAFFPIEGKYKAYAISIGNMVDWEISTSNIKIRRTYGRVKKPESARECVDLLVERGALTDTITPGDFFQEGYKSPRYRN